MEVYATLDQMPPERRDLDFMKGLAQTIIKLVIEETDNASAVY